MDRFSEKQRSYVMSRVRSRDTKPEMVVRRYLHRNGFRYRLHEKNLPGKPDLVLPKYRSVVFVHGCFWHRHQGCPRATMPASRVRFWEEKFKKNLLRDRQNRAELASLKWKVWVIWECELASEEKRSLNLAKLREKVLQSVNT